MNTNSLYSEIIELLSTPGPLFSSESYGFYDTKGFIIVTSAPIAKKLVEHMNHEDLHAASNHRIVYTKPNLDNVNDY